MDKRISFLATEEFKKALKSYCDDRNLTMSGFVKSRVAKKLIKHKYLEEKGKHE